MIQYEGPPGMLFLDKRLMLWHYLVAIILAIGVTMALGWGLSVTIASGCYDSLCLLPLLMLIVPPCAAPVLAALFALNRRFGTPVPDGWLPTVVGSGVAVQIVLSLVIVATASPQSRDIFFSDLISVPEGFGVGLAIGAAFWGALYTFGRENPPVPR